MTRTARTSRGASGNSKRARAAQESIVGTYESVVEGIEAEIALREERVRNLEGALAS
jgi:alkanesulfonate monooxygenase SsuD/methylene tetrahydromethanopterin reductase-like flavin-dependent oxidoreductase (luciferase family)